MNEYLGIGHVAVYTKDLEESIAFYEMIGGENVERVVRHLPTGDRHMAFVDYGGVTFEFLLRDEVPGEGTIPHVAIYVKHLEDIVADLKKRGVTTFETETKNVAPDLLGGMQSWFFRGPSGERLELLERLS